MLFRKVLDRELRSFCLKFGRACYPNKFCKPIRLRQMDGEMSNGDTWWFVATLPFNLGFSPLNDVSELLILYLLSAWIQHKYNSVTLVMIDESRGRQSLLEFYYTLFKRFHRTLVYILYTTGRVKLYLIQPFICPVFKVLDLTVVSFGFFSSGRGKYK